MKKLFNLTEKQTNYLIYAIAGLILLFVLWKFIFQPMIQREETPAESGASGGGTTPAPKKPSKPVYTDSTVFSKKTPMMTDKRVQWMQYKYNQYAKERKKYGKTPNWPTITEDGKFGSNTAAAMTRLMGKSSASWNGVKTRVDYLMSELVKNGLKGEQKQPSLIDSYDDPYGYKF